MFQINTINIKMSDSNLLRWMFPDFPQQQHHHLPTELFPALPTSATQHHTPETHVTLQSLSLLQNKIYHQNNQIRNINNSDDDHCF